MQDRKKSIFNSENLSGRSFLLTCFKTVTLRLFGFLFSSPDGCFVADFLIYVLLHLCHFLSDTHPSLLTACQRARDNRCVLLGIKFSTHPLPLVSTRRSSLFTFRHVLGKIGVFQPGLKNRSKNNPS